MSHKSLDNKVGTLLHLANMTGHDHLLIKDQVHHVLTVIGMQNNRLALGLYTQHPHQTNHTRIIRLKANAWQELSTTLTKARDQHHQEKVLFELPVENGEPIHGYFLFHSFDAGEWVINSDDTTFRVALNPARFHTLLEQLNHSN